MAVIYGQSITRLRATNLRNDSGALVPQADWSTATETQITGVSVQPRSTSETRDAGGIQPTADWTIYSRPGVILDLTTRDRVRWDGIVYDVVGSPQAWAGHHSEVIIRKSPVTRLDASGTAGVLSQGLAGAANAQEPYSP